MSGLRKDRSERPFKTNNRKQRDEPQSEPVTESETEPESARPSWSAEQSIGDLGALRASFQKSPARRQLRDHATQNSISVFSLQSSVSSLRFRLVSFRLISSFLGRAGQAGAKSCLNCLRDEIPIDATCFAICFAFEALRSKIATIYCRVHAPIAIKLCHIHCGTRRA